jgi:ATP-binding cassette subfamily B protein
LVKLAVRLYDPWQGSVKIDGQDLRDVTIRSVRTAVSIVLQEPHLFTGSIADNIRYAQQQADTLHVERVGLLAQISGFAAVLGGGYDSPVGPRGAWLSGGQRQRIAIARALLRDSPILILDEASAAVDGETEDRIQDEIDRLAGKTLLIIGHRLSSIRHADRVVLLENGRVVEVGTPAELLGADTRCRALFATQLVSGDLAA